MRTQSADTRPEAERFLIELIRKASLAKRFSFTRSLSHNALSMNRRNIQKQHPNLSKEEALLIFVTRRYGQMLAHGLQASLEKRRQEDSSHAPDLLLTIKPVVEAFEQLGVSYYITGTVANSMYGMQRGSMGVDLVADLHLNHLSPLVERLRPVYYLDEEDVQKAIEHSTSFSLLHLGSILKVEVLLPQSRLFDRIMFQRIQKHALDENCSPFCLPSPEDVILRQLEVYRNDGESADDQWNEILGVLKVQGMALDLSYLQEWAATLKVADLLERALIEAGFKV